MPPKQAKEHIFNVQDPQINVDIALTPEEGGEIDRGGGRGGEGRRGGRGRRGAREGGIRCLPYVVQCFWLAFLKTV